jgi:hypothetical protein
MGRIITPFESIFISLSFEQPAIMPWLRSRQAVFSDFTKQPLLRAPLLPAPNISTMFLSWHHRPAVGRPRSGGSMRTVSPFTVLAMAAALACGEAPDGLAGGELVFTMQATPNLEWGKDSSARPYTQTAY